MAIIQLTQAKKLTTIKNIRHIQKFFSIKYFHCKDLPVISFQENSSIWQVQFNFSFDQINKTFIIYL